LKIYQAEGVEKELDMNYYGMALSNFTLGYIHF
jgi:hypothetical protein